MARQQSRRDAGIANHGGGIVVGFRTGMVVVVIVVAGNARARSSNFGKVF